MISSVYYGIRLADLVVLNPYSPIDTSIYELAVTKYIDTFFIIGLTALIVGVVILFLINYKRISSC
ncbi:hypothetical protein PQ478_10635 [Alkalihalophilus pseudofirmus]|uniref:hypothetical protein n=1 Tax=Alkalihalophilus pseudofirmus TaxID=79885 RepID=UPI00259B785A|nr:hypothetical protein [Alkalihalophilus pseudofirmus]WEG18916.1 hypothetical protein PQ478_10635 [Alkalihalophilus pseudofirmus]